MYTEHLPASLPENWIIVELDEDYEYLEFLGFDGEFLISLMPHPEENPSLPYFLTLSQLKGILGRYDFEDLEWPEWHANPAEAVRSAVELMEWMNENYSNFLPLTTEILVSLGMEDQLLTIKRYFEGELKIRDLEGQALVFKTISLLEGSNSYEESAMRSLSDFAKSCGLGAEEIRGGLLVNEKFEWIRDLREEIRNRIRVVYPIA